MAVADTEEDLLQVHIPASLSCPVETRKIKLPLTLDGLSEMQGTQIQSLSWEDPLEKGLATHCSILAWEIPWEEEPGGQQCMESQRVRHDWMTNTLEGFAAQVQLKLTFCSEEALNELDRRKWIKQKKGKT